MTTPNRCDQHSTPDTANKYWAGDTPERRTRLRTSLGDHADVSPHGGSHTAARLELRRIGRALSGHLGIPAAVYAWSSVAATAIIAFYVGFFIDNFPLVFGLGATLTVALLLWAIDVHPHWAHYLLVASLFTGTMASAFAWWSVGLTIDAADSLVDPPAITDWTGTAVVTALASSLGVMIATASMVTARTHHRSTGSTVERRHATTLPPVQQFHV